MAFMKLKDVIITTPVLRRQDFSKEFVIEYAFWRGLGLVNSDKNPSKPAYTKELIGLALVI